MRSLAESIARATRSTCSREFCCRTRVSETAGESLRFFVCMAAVSSPRLRPPLPRSGSRKTSDESPLPSKSPQTFLNSCEFRYIACNPTDPISLTGTFAVMRFLRVTLNTLSLFGLVPTGFTPKQDQDYLMVASNLLGGASLARSAIVTRKVAYVLITAVFSGMLGVTIGGLFVTPEFYEVLRKFRSHLITNGCLAKLHEINRASPVLRSEVSRRSRMD
jgi:hypothetical protein